jgi:hypothetical protein
MPQFQKSLFEITADDRRQADAELRKQQRSVEYDSKEFTVEILVHKFANDDIFIPDYQRQLVWTEERQSKFVESVLLGLPIPYLFGADNTDTGQIEIVDGAQRLYTWFSSNLVAPETGFLSLKRRNPRLFTWFGPPGARPQTRRTAHPIARRPLASLEQGERRPTGSRAAGLEAICSLKCKLLRRPTENCLRSATRGL